MRLWAVVNRHEAWSASDCNLEWAFRTFFGSWIGPKGCFFDDAISRVRRTKAFGVVLPPLLVMMAIVTIVTMMTIRVEVGFDAILLYSSLCLELIA